MGVRIEGFGLCGGVVVWWCGGWCGGVVEVEVIWVRVVCMGGPYVCT